MANYIYVIAEAGSGFIKVGVAQNPRARLSTLQTGNPRKLSLEFVHECQSRLAAEQVEYRAHGTMLRWRKEGEWFDVPLDHAIQEVKWACNFVQNYTARVGPNTLTTRSRSMGFDYAEFLAEELATEAEEALKLEGHDGAHTHH